MTTPHQTTENGKKKRKANRRASSSPCVDEDRRASDENPNHLEDFNSLLRAAVRKPEPKD
jgi:hypothetical protein